jgi:hypothetical protein
MSVVDPSDSVMRVGDRERREVDDRLRAAQSDGVLTLVEYDERTAQCWAARTRADLAPLVADLPPAEGAPTTDAPVASPPSRRRSPLRRGAVVPAIFLAVAALVGVQVVGATDGAAVFGSRTVPVGTQQTVDVGTLFGSTEVVVPEGTIARTSGSVLFGSVRCEAACALPPGAPTLREVQVDAGGAFGSVEVVTPGELAQGGLRDHDRDGDRNGDRDDDDR